MAKLRRQPVQLVFPFELRVGDILVEDGGRLEVVSRPAATSSGKTTRAWVRREGEAVQGEAVRETWRKIPVVRPPAA